MEAVCIKELLVVKCYMYILAEDGKVNDFCDSQRLINNTTTKSTFILNGGRALEAEPGMEIYKMRDSTGSI